MYSSSASQRLLADLQMNLEEETQFRLAGYIQAVVEEYADDLDEERKARQKAIDSDTEMDSDVSPAKAKRRGRKKKVADNASLEPPSASRMAKDYDFQASIAPFIQGIRAEKISFEHAAVILTHYGRFGVLYDQVSKILTEMLRTRWQLGDNGAVAVVVQDSMRGAFTLYLNDQIHSDEAAISLARLFATYFIHRGAHLAVLGRLPSKSLLEIHKDLIDYLVRKLRRVQDDEAATTKVASLFRGLMHLVATGTPTEETLNLYVGLHAAYHI
jgi:cohesin complex subunit SA-1/2